MGTNLFFEDLLGNKQANRMIKSTTRITKNIPPTIMKAMAAVESLNSPSPALSVVTSLPSAEEFEFLRTIECWPPPESDGSGEILEGVVEGGLIVAEGGVKGEFISVVGDETGVVGDATGVVVDDLGVVVDIDVVVLAVLPGGVFGDGSSYEGTRSSAQWMMEFLTHLDVLL